ncbi:flavin reductase family protein [Lutibaculum baratangense]|uniref:Nitrilotriacetate monooxygenase component B n=1 Tax=Lutibaculum baratangense AMV1 TaxID=631454 RepID=V4RDK1_9HYPH|nr:flavin reductase family protein [Lutibaculum baratangense]ESR23444.1 Nitrilotriacetate monooxygenase component B [Lutibaculum baratangense AMV1]
MSEATLAPHDPRAFRNALGAFATGVCVVTAEVGEERLGMTVNSFSSVSLDPPLVLFSVATAARGIEGWRQAQHYAVNVLAWNQQDVSNRFARAATDKWQGVAVETGVTGAPLIAGAVARFECRAEHQYPGGDHLIFVGRVLRYDLPRPDAEPLVFQAGRYRELTKDHDMTVPADALWLLGW